MPSTELPSVGFIGLDAEGGPLARALADNGYPLHLWAARPEPQGELDDHPHTGHSSVDELAAASDVVALFLNDADNIKVAVEGGLLAAMRRGSVLVNHANGLPAQARRLADLAAAYGVGFLDAPVSGGPVAAQTRQLTTIVGGNADLVKRLSPLFSTFSTDIVRVGPVGSGEFGKLFNNALMAMNHKNVLDVLHLAVGLDLPIASLLEVLRSGSAGSVALQAIGPAVTAENVNILTPLELEDMRLFAEAVSAVGDNATSVVERAVAGARQLPELTALVIG
ncbi:NAD(P)-dependent oxidoreductase [Streptomyces sp. NPDC001307]|uniref:NAD(P)-dependent oxidoreductase n=1 Tax=Streptomyces sp. NPDC001307 TaxID=3364560 RepID=UPI0036A20906